MMIRLEQFSGVAPKISRRLLPDNMARDARNCRLLSGELRGLHALTVLHQFDTPAKTAFRITGTPDTWVGFVSENVDFVKGPLVNDAYDRYYWTGDTPDLQYNTLQRIKDADPSYKVGVPIPTAAPVVGSIVATPTVGPYTASGAPSLQAIYARGVVGNQAQTVDPAAPAAFVPDELPDPIVETRAYVYTFVNELGEEGAPSDPVVASGEAAGIWTIEGLSVTPTDTIGRMPVTKRRLYRTVTGQASALFYFVAEIDDMVTTTFEDDIISSVVVQNKVCQSFNWDTPPDGLQGLTAHPSGFFVAFKGREVYCSEPYRPWAWPTEYILAVEQDIVGLAIYGNMVMVMTKSNPYYLAGTHPGNLSPHQSQSIEPCMSKRSIVATLQGVLYASPNGLVLFNEMGASVTTNSLVSRDEWSQQFTPQTIKAAQRGLSYIAFRDGANGFIYSPMEPLGALSTIDRFVNVDNILTDKNSGLVYLISNNTVYEWDNPNNLPVYYTWRSKEFDLPRPLNFGACIIKMEGYEYQPPDSTLTEEQETWNASRMTRPLNPLGYTPVGGSRWAMTPTLGSPNFNTTPDYETEGYDRRKYSLGGSPLFPTSIYVSPTGFSAILKVYADRRLVATLAVMPNKTMRLPSGFKAHFWQFELISNVNVYSIAVAETAKELMNG